MKKRLLLMLLSFALCMIPMTVFASSGETAVTSDADKLPAPTNVHWVTTCQTWNSENVYPGYISWNGNNGDTHRYRIKLYDQNDNLIYKTGYYFTDQEWIGYNGSLTSDLILEELKEAGSGTYRFSVQCIDNDNAERNSDEVYSDGWSFTLSEDVLEAPEGLVRDGLNLNWDSVLNADGYRVKVEYAETVTEEPEQTFYCWWRYHPYSDLETCYELQTGEGQAIDEPGYYYISIRSLSNDITVQDSPYSKCISLYYDGTNLAKISKGEGSSSGGQGSSSGGQGDGGDGQDGNVTDEDTAISLGECRTRQARTVSMDLKLENNPGISLLRLKLNTGEGVTLRDVVNGTIIEDMDTGLNLLWSADKDSNEDGALATLTFDIAKDAPVGDSPLKILIRECYNEDGDAVTVKVLNGMLHIIDFIYGDANDDDVVNGIDVLLMRKYLANYDDDTQTSSETVYDGADANGDDVINGKDLLLLRKYMANYDDETGTSSVTLGPND